MDVIKIKAMVASIKSHEQDPELKAACVEAFLLGMIAGKDQNIKELEAELETTLNQMRQREEDRKMISLEDCMPVHKPASM